MPRRSTYTLEPGHPTPGLHNLLRLPIASKRGIGLLTDFPSTTPFGLALGADSPCTDERGAGNLGLSASGPFTRFIATHVSIRTSDTSSNPYRSPSQAYRTLSYRVSVPFNPLLISREPQSRGLVRLRAKLKVVVRPRCGQSNKPSIEAMGLSLKYCYERRNELKGTLTPASSVHSLSPVTSSAQNDSTSELLRFL